MKRLALIAAVGAILVGCGGGGDSSGVVLRPTSPLLANLYLQVRFPSGAPHPIWRALSQTVSSTGVPVQFIVAPATHGQKDCSITHQIPSDRLASLRKYAGQTLGLAVYGNSRFAQAFCQHLSSDRLWEGEKVYGVPSSAMEPTLHCAMGPAFVGCLGGVNDRVVVRLSGVTDLRRRDIVVFTTPKEAAVKCGEGGTLVKRIIGLPGEAVREDDKGFIWIRSPGATSFVRLKETYVSAERRLADAAHFGQTWHVPAREYFLLGDNRAESCDSRTWGSVPARNIIGPVVQIIRGGQILRPAGIP